MEFAVVLLSGFFPSWGLPVELWWASFENGNGV